MFDLHANVTACTASGTTRAIASIASITARSTITTGGRLRRVRSVGPLTARLASPTAATVSTFSTTGREPNGTAVYRSTVAIRNVFADRLRTPSRNDLLSFQLDKARLATAGGQR
jgi:hypothetical protein